MRKLLHLNTPVKLKTFLSCCFFCLSARFVSCRERVCRCGFFRSIQLVHFLQIYIYMYCKWREGATIYTSTIARARADPNWKLYQMRFFTQIYILLVKREREKKYIQQIPIPPIISTVDSGRNKNRVENIPRSISCGA